jgi:hypothetical protein
MSSADVCYQALIASEREGSKSRNFLVFCRLLQESYLGRTEVVFFESPWVGKRIGFDKENTGEHFWFAEHRIAGRLTKRNLQFTKEKEGNGVIAQLDRATDF